MDNVKKTAGLAKCSTLLCDISLLTGQLTRQSGASLTPQLLNAEDEAQGAHDAHDVSFVVQDVLQLPEHLKLHQSEGLRWTDSMLG